MSLVSGNAPGADSDFSIVCDGLLFPEGPVALADGSVVLVEIGAGCITRVFADGRKQKIAETGGGPNGAAIGPDGALYVCNNGGSRLLRYDGFVRIVGQADDYSGGRIERVDLTTGKVEKLYTDCGRYPLRGPNDLIFDSSGGFWFTDLGKSRKRERDRGGVYYAQPDGSAIEEVIYPLHTPNGIGLSPDERTLYVSETETARLWKFDLEAPGRPRLLPYPSPNGGTMVAVGANVFQRFDSLKLQSDGKICVATLERAGFSIFDSEGNLADFISAPDRLTTNLCFGGNSNETAWATLSSTGRLARRQWPAAGLPLNFSDRAVF